MPLISPEGLENGDKGVFKINKYKTITSDDITLYLALTNPKKKNNFYILKEMEKKKLLKLNQLK